MGKLTITGEAEKEFSYDQMEITIRFQVYGASSAKAIAKMTDQCERFLKSIDEAGIFMENIHLGMDKVDQEREDNKTEACATREIKIRVPFDMKVSNYFLSLVKDYKYDVDINTSYRLSNTLEIHNSLIKAAIADSRDKAYFIAEAMDQKISGIDSIEIEKNYGNKMDWMCREQELDLPMADVFKYSNQLKSPVTNISASVEVVWLIE